MHRWVLVCALSFRSLALGRNWGSHRESGLVSREPSAAVTVGVQRSLPESGKGKCWCPLGQPI